MYQPSHSISVVKGIGDKLVSVFSERGINTIKDLLLFLPLRYEDRSETVTISQLAPGKLQTFEATVNSVSNFYKGRRSIQSAKVSDETGSVKLMWFNNKWITQTLKKGEQFRFSGSFNPKYKNISQPTVERVESDTVHSGRLVPIYSTIPEIKAGKLRRILKEVIDHLAEIPDVLQQLDQSTPSLSLKQTFQQLHFPDETELVVTARERLALEELLALIKHSTKIKQAWQKLATAPALTFDHQPNQSSFAELVPETIPFELTAAQKQATKTILNDISETTPMNRLLIGDVGSGKTVVAGIAAWHCIQQGLSVSLIAPTQILAKQHAATFAKMFPDLPVQLIVSGSKLNPVTVPTVYVGTHALINNHDRIKPGLIIYDEQHRFGVKQRSATTRQTPHLLTMSATPIPRSLMLTIFSHLQLSTLDEMPPGRIPVKTWITPPRKQPAAFDWIGQQLVSAQDHQLALVVCPFIETSTTEGFEQIAAVVPEFERLQTYYKKTFPDLRIAMLHGKMSASEKQVTTQQLFNQEIDILITTPIIEVGLDVASASIIVIKGAERFGMASLHQLRGRVGRAGQQAYCLVMGTLDNHNNSERLKQFSETTNGLKLAELDLQRRGAGDLFGTQQHGLDNLRFAEWTNLKLITKARATFENLEAQTNTWSSFFSIDQSTFDQNTPAAN